MRITTLLALFLSALIIAGCGGGKSKEQKLKEEQQEEFIDSLPETDNLKVRWERDLGEFNKFGFNFVVDSGASYSIDADGRLMAVDLDSGKVIWQHKSGVDINAGIGVGPDLLYAVDSDANLIAFDRDGGEALWETPLLTEVLIPPVVAAGNVIVKTLDAKVIGFDAVTGEQIWIYRHPKPGLTLRGGATPLVDRNFIFTGFADGKLVAIDAVTGNELWDVPVGKTAGRDEIQRLTDIDAQPVIDRNDLYVGAFQRRIMALDLAGGSIQWIRPVSTFRNFALDDTALYVINQDNIALALDRASGQLLWAQEQFSEVELTSISLIGDKLLLTDDEGRIYLLFRTDGEIIGRESISGGSPLVQPKVINGISYILTEDGTLKAVTLDSLL